MSESLSFLSSMPMPSDALVLQVHHRHDLVVLSLIVALVSNCAAFAMLQTHRSAHTKTYRRISLLCSSMVLGLGIWAMHFIGMLAMQHPVVVSYDVLITSFSILPGILAAFFALWAFQQGTLSTQRTLLCGAVIGLGIGAMHYSGIAAMQAQATVRFTASMFVLSLLMGVVFATLSFWVQSRLIHPSTAHSNRWWRFLPPTLMTVAIGSMHYLSMHSMYWVVAPSASDFSQSVTAVAQDNTPLSLLIAGMAVAVLTVLGLANALLRYRDLWQALAARDARLKAMVDAAPDGVVTIDDKGLIQDFNPQAQHIFGYTASEVMGRNISCLMPSPLAEQHDNHLRKHQDKPQMPISINGREVLGKHKDGRLIPLQLSVGKATPPSGTIFVGYLQDISMRKKADAQLRIAASVFEHMQEGVAIVDANHNVSDVNPAFLRLMETSREACLGKSIESLYEEADIPPDMGQLWQTVAKHQYWQSECMLTRSNGTFWMQRLSISPVLNEFKRPHHFIAVVSDVTERPGLEVMLPHADLHDAATGLANQKLFMDRLTSCLMAGRKKLTAVGVLLIQVSGVQTPAMQPHCADCTGALQLIAHLMEQELRSTDTVARYAHHQLAILLPGLQSPEDFHLLVQRLTRALVQTISTSNKYAVYNVEMGSAYSGASTPIHTPAQLIEQAQSSCMALPAPPPSKVAQ